MVHTLTGTLQSHAVFLLAQSSVPRVSSQMLGILLHKNTEAVRMDPLTYFPHIIYKICHL